MAIDAAHIREHMEVIGPDGRHIGVVDRVEGDRIKLTKSDLAAGGEHRYIGLDQVETVDDAVRLSTSGATAASGTG